MSTNRDPVGQNTFGWVIKTVVNFGFQSWERLIKINLLSKSTIKVISLYLEFRITLISNGLMLREYMVMKCRVSSIGRNWHTIMSTSPLHQQWMFAWQHRYVKVNNTNISTVSFVSFHNLSYLFISCFKPLTFHGQAQKWWNHQSSSYLWTGFLIVWMDVPCMKLLGQGKQIWHRTQHLMIKDFRW